MTCVLVVDDDRHLRLAMGKALGRKGAHVIERENGKDALEPLRDGAVGDQQIDVCVLDIRMPELDGIEVLRQTIGRQVPVVVLTGHGSIEDAVEAMRLGASNFVQKPVDADELWPVLQQAAKERGQSAHGDSIWGESPALTQFLSQLDRAASSEEPVLLLGETGTGKELCARRLHAQSANAAGPFVAFNAACVPRELFESELFGHKKGAFTGADQNREGLLAQAAGGTLFVDEVGDLPLDAQSKLLRALEERSFRPVGSDEERPFRARLCAATHQDLPGMVERGEFRADLYYRLSVLPLVLPPLRDRADDAVLIAERLIAQLRPSLTLSDDAKARLREYRFPGNVRELQNLMKRASILAEGFSLTRDEVDRLLAGSPFQSIQPSSPSGAATLDDGTPRAGERITLEELEKTHITRLLDELNNVSEVARIVGIDRRTLQRKMIAWGLRDDDS